MELSTERGIAGVSGSRVAWEDLAAQCCKLDAARSARQLLEKLQMRGVRRDW
jgi:hypothetical protein